MPATSGDEDMFATYESKEEEEVSKPTMPKPTTTVPVTKVPLLQCVLIGCEELAEDGLCPKDGLPKRACCKEHFHLFQRFGQLAPTVEAAVEVEDEPYEAVRPRRLDEEEGTDLFTRLYFLRKYDSLS